MKRTAKKEVSQTSLSLSMVNQRTTERTGSMIKFRITERVGLIFGIFLSSFVMFVHLVLFHSSTIKFCRLILMVKCPFEVSGPAIFSSLADRV